MSKFERKKPMGWVEGDTVVEIMEPLTQDDIDKGIVRPKSNNRIDWNKQPAVVYCWDCGWNGSPRKSLNKHVNAFAICPKCRAGLKNRSLEEVLKEHNGALPWWLR